MSKQAASYIQLELYEDSVNLLGIAKVKLPAITYPCVNIAGAGMMGNMEVPLYGMVDAMSMTINWLSPTHGWQPRKSTSWICGLRKNTGMWKRQRKGFGRKNTL